jgi:hypothetical protein
LGEEKRDGDWGARSEARIGELVRSRFSHLWRIGDQATNRASLSASYPWVLLVEGPTHHGLFHYQTSEKSFNCIQRLR